MNQRESRLVASQRFEQALVELEGSDGVVVSASFDLRPDGTGAPAARRILRQAVRMALSPEVSDPERERLANAFSAIIDDAATAGHAGLLSAGTLEVPDRWLLPALIPPRNRLQASPTASRFELQRYRALLRIAMAAVWADRSTLSWAVVRGEESPSQGRLEADTHYMRASLGRTGQHGRSGTPDRPAGGHGKTRIERSAEEERERFARACVEALEPEITGVERVLLDGPPEFTSRLTGRLPREVQERLQAAEHQGTVDQAERVPDPASLVERARDGSARAQYEHAADLARDIRTGLYGARALLDTKAVVQAAEEGRLDTLVLHEDAVDHFGDAVDTRYREAKGDAGATEELLRSAMAQATTCWFLGEAETSSGDDGAAEAETSSNGDILGIARW